MVVLPVSWGVQPCINRRCSWSTDGCSSFTAATAAKRDALVVLSANQYGSITLHAVSTAAQLAKPGQEVLQRGGSNPGARSFVFRSGLGSRARAFPGQRAAWRSAGEHASAFVRVAVGVLVTRAWRGAREPGQRGAVCGRLKPARACRLCARNSHASTQHVCTLMCGADARTAACGKGLVAAWRGDRRKQGQACGWGWGLWAGGAEEVYSAHAC